MSWILIALGGAAVAGVINVLDKTVMYRYARSPFTLPLLIGVAQSLVGVVLILILAPPASATGTSVGWAIGSGALWGTGGLIMLRVMYSQEATRTVPIYQTFPIFAAVMGIVFLDEHLSALHWAAIVATVAGAALLAMRHDDEYKRLFLHKSFFILMVASAIAASAHMASKLAVTDMPVLYTHALRSLGLGGILLAAGLRPQAIRDVGLLLRDRRAAFAFVGTNEFALATVSLMLGLWALSLGPVGPVTALTATRSAFLLLYSTALALKFKGFMGEKVTGGAMLLKGVSVALMILGIAGIALG